jgi:Ca2+-binding EF-hand superfamily protein
MRPSLAVTLLCCLAAGLPAVAPPAPAGRLLPGDAHDLVVLHPARPYRLRLHLRVGTKPYHADWADQMATLFAHLDTDGNGVLSRAEASRAPSRDQWLQMTRGERHLEPDAAPDFAALAGDRGKVDLEQLSAYYRDSSAGPLQMSWGARPAEGNDALSDALWRQLDTNRDGKLARAELEAAPQVLGKLDLNEDEMVSQSELMGFPGVYIESPPQVSRGRAHDRASGGLPFFSFSPVGPAAPLVQALLARYDRDRNRKLSAAEIGLPAALFRKLDSNGDGQLDATELARWLDEPPDVELTVPLEPRPCRGVAARPAAVPLHTLRDGITVVLHDWAIDVRVQNAQPPPVPRGMPQARAAFRALDTNRDGYLSSKEVYQPPFTYVSWLRLADRDGDGRLSEKEFTAFAELQQRLGSRATFLRVEDEGRSLFRLLDADRDGRLGPRELRSAWKRLSRWDKSGKGVLTRAMIPHHYRVTVRHGQPSTYFTPAPTHPPARGPLWFRKMDRNGDGDVSRAEWLGTRKQFDEIDTDGDGLISLAEAEAYDRRKRKKE